MRWRHAVPAGLILALTAVPAAGDEAGISARGAWVREAPPGMAMLAGYVELRNSTARRHVLVAASSAEFETVTLHRTVVKDGMAGMTHAPQIELAPAASLSLAPGGYHLMLMNPRRTLRAGDSVVVDLKFRGGLVLPVAFQVRK